MSATVSSRLAIAAIVSGQGRGTNVQALLDACANGEIPARMGVVIATRSDAPVLERAPRHAGCHRRCIPAQVSGR